MTTSQQNLVASLVENEAFAPIDAYFKSAAATATSQVEEETVVAAAIDNLRARLQTHWQAIYPDCNDDNNESNTSLLNAFVLKLQQWRTLSHSVRPPPPANAHKQAVVYGMYVDLFAGGDGTFDAAVARLPHLAALGVTCVWLLPVLESPLLDAGFDISDYASVRASLGGTPAFERFVDAAHARGILVLFDVAINHCSASHRWFVDACARADDSPFRDFFLWSRDASEWPEARVIFRGIETSNWQRLDDSSGRFYFHRFFKHQPDLNYRSPAVLLVMASALLGWAVRGVDGFRLDAVPCLWKEGDCESRPQVHSIVKFFRAALDFVRPNTFLLAEACQLPRDVVRYFGDGDECHAAYHFPLMPAIFLALARQNGTPVFEQMRDLPPISGHWFTFLRVHDELTLEMAAPDVRDELLRAYRRDPSWDFRDGLGISARLADLLHNDARRILLAFSIELTLIGTPLIMYGDEVGKRNDVAFFDEQLARTGLNDTRYLVRGHLDWSAIEADLATPQSTAARVFNGLRAQLTARRTATALFALGSTEIVTHNQVLAYRRVGEDNNSVLVVNNLSEQAQEFRGSGGALLLASEGVTLSDNIVQLPAYGYAWIR
jgi:maltose alpha-D-glucosyltransferase/alpha-amylase